MFSTCGATSPKQRGFATIQFFYVEPVRYTNNDQAIGTSNVTLLKSLL